MSCQSMVSLQQTKPLPLIQHIIRYTLYREREIYRYTLYREREIYRYTLYREREIYRYTLYIQKDIKIRTPVGDGERHRIHLICTPAHSVTNDVMGEGGGASLSHTPEYTVFRREREGQIKREGNRDRKGQRRDE